MFLLAWLCNSNKKKFKKLQRIKKIVPSQLNSKRLVLFITFFLNTFYLIAKKLLANKDHLPSSLSVTAEIFGQ